MGLPGPSGAGAGGKTPGGEWGKAPHRSAPVCPTPGPGVGGLPRVRIGPRDAQRSPALLFHGRPPGGVQGGSRRIGAGQYAGVARLAEFLKFKRYPCGVGLACRGLMSRESVPAGGQGGGRDSRPLRGLGRAPKSACRAGPAPGSRGQGSRVGFGATPQGLAPCVSLNFNACDLGSGAVAGPGAGGRISPAGAGGRAPRWGVGQGPAWG